VGNGANGRDIGPICPLGQPGPAALISISAEHRGAAARYARKRELDMAMCGPICRVRMMARPHPRDVSPPNLSGALRRRFFVSGQTRLGANPRGWVAVGLSNHSRGSKGRRPLAGLGAEPQTFFVLRQRQSQHRAQSGPIVFQAQFAAVQVGYGKHQR
jgi:hypothetical protein